ncbi:Protein of unknown function [Bacillus mycoides]|nr:Protein of unknown function [Bacillus mycoides]
MELSRIRDEFSDIEDNA